MNAVLDGVLGSPRLACHTRRCLVSLPQMWKQCSELRLGSCWEERKRKMFSGWRWGAKLPVFYLSDPPSPLEIDYMRPARTLVHKPCFVSSLPALLVVPANNNSNYNLLWAHSSNSSFKARDKPTMHWLDSMAERQIQKLRDENRHLVAKGRMILHESKNKVLLFKFSIFSKYEECAMIYPF